VVPVSRILQVIEEIAPARYTFEFDRVGLQVGSPGATVTSAVLSLDRSLAAVEFAQSVGAQLLVSHHPLTLKPLETVTEATYEGRTALAMVRAGINFIAAHTNWDSARGGVNDALASILGLTDVEDFGFGQPVPMWIVEALVPIDQVLDAVAALERAGGTFLREKDGVVVARFPRDLQSAARRTLDAGDWQYAFLESAPVILQPAGRIGRLAEPVSARDYAGVLRDQLGIEPLMFSEPDRLISRVAVVGGAADSEWRAAQLAGADLFVTGEIKQHVALEAQESGLALACCGHYATEQPGVVALRDRLAATVPEVTWHLFEPAIGSSGRPWTAH
jgi:dinuclear metal center YbgI/SA1388 family protein